MECWLTENVELNSHVVMCHYEVKGHISTIVFIGNIIILQFLAQTLLPTSYRTLNVGPELTNRVRKCGIA